MSTTLEELRRLTLEQQRAEKTAAGSDSSAREEARLLEGEALMESKPPMEGEAPAEPRDSAHREVRPPELNDPAHQEVRPPGDAHLRISADAQVRKQASKQVSKQVLAQASKQASEQVLAQASKQATRSTSFLVRVREGIARKTVHPGGIKASVDMSPELSLRVKRYCLDHGNIPVRLVFIELLTAFLEEEGY